MDKYKKFIYLIIANGISLISSIFSGFIIPNLLGIEDFGYWQIFVLYSSYLGLFHFGILDGIYIKYGDKNFNELNLSELKSTLTFIMILESLIAFSLFLYSFKINEMELRFIIIAISISIIVNNINSFFSIISQITKKFNVYSINTILSRSIYWITVAAIFLSHKFSFEIFIIIQIFIDIIILLNYMFKFRAIMKQKLIFIKIKDIINLLKIGIFIMVGNLIALLTLKTGNFFVQHRMSIEAFSIYSFASNTRALIILFINSFALFLYPYLKRINSDIKLKEFYEDTSLALSIIVSFGLNSFFIVQIIISRYLTDYFEAIEISSILFASQIFLAQIFVISLNYFKVFSLNKEYLVSNIFAICISSILIILFLKVDFSLKSISFSVLVSSFLWSIVLDVYFNKRLRVKFIKRNLLNMLLCIIFLFFTLYEYFESVELNIIGYNLSILILTIITFRKRVKKYFKEYVRIKL